MSTPARTHTTRATTLLAVTITYAAAATGYCPRTIRRYIRLGKLQTIGNGRGLRIVYASLVEFINEVNA